MYTVNINRPVIPPNIVFLYTVIIISSYVNKSVNKSTDTIKPVNTSYLLQTIFRRKNVLFLDHGRPIFRPFDALFLGQPSV